MPFICKIDRQTDYNSFPPSHPIVIDNGASYFRIGWAGESEPRVVFRNIVQRPRHKHTGETVTVVGDNNIGLLKYFDCTRSGPRSAFDNNVVYQFEIMEYILDFGFDRLGVDGPEVNHPVLITECPCNPVASRSKMAELLFESYGVPSVAFGVDAAFSYTYNLRLGVCNKEGIAVSSGFNTSHVIPFIDGEPIFEACCRTNVGGYHVTDYLKQLLSLKYPQHISKLTWETVEDLKMEHCYVAQDYASEVKLFQIGTKEAEEKNRIWQLPFIPPPVEEQPSEEELARKAAIKERQGQRLREMAAAKKASRINELVNEITSIEFLLRQLENVEESGHALYLKETGYTSKKELETSVAKKRDSLRRAKGEQIETEETDVPTADKFPLVDIPDNLLTPEQLGEKRKQIAVKSMSDGRQKLRQRRAEEELLKEKQIQQEEEKRLENPELYLEQLRAKYTHLSEKVEQKKRSRTNGNNSNGNHTSGGVGRGERLTAFQKNRMRLLTTAAFDRGKGEDTFGMKDDDWQLYKLMSKDNDDDDDDQPDEDEAEFSRISSRLQEIDPTFKPECGLHQSAEVPRVRPLTKEDFQIVMGVERFRCPEIIFHPCIIGIDQSGLDEMVGVSMRRFSPRDQGLGEKLTSSIFLTGGSCQFPGVSGRLETGVRMIRPCGSPIKVIQADDPVLDAWRGASTLAASSYFLEQTFTRMDYYENGEDWLRRYKLRYMP